MLDEEKINEVARAICNVRYDGWCLPEHISQFLCRAEAIAAIEAVELARQQIEVG
jgi:hypothetical protein